jgi:DNA-binding response OmpR family regulator
LASDEGATVSVKILLVGRGQGSRDRLRLALERLEASGETISFLEAPNGNQALLVVEAERPDLVVVEIGVTPYGGFGLTRDIKSFPQLTCPVIVILERPQDEWLGRWCGADALVSRPVDPFELAQTARRLLVERREAAAAGGGAR